MRLARVSTTYAVAVPIVPCCRRRSATEQKGNVAPQLRSPRALPWGLNWGGRGEARRDKAPEP